MQPSWQMLPAQACSATVNEKWSSDPSWSEKRGRSSLFSCRMSKNEFAKRRHGTEPTRWKRATQMCYLFIFFHDVKIKFQLCVRYKVRRASGAINSSAGGLMKTSSLKCHLHRTHVDHLSHSGNIPPGPWHERYKNAIWGAAKSIMRCVMGGNDRNTTSYYTFWPRPRKYWNNLLTQFWPLEQRSGSLISERLRD